jgi:YtkA-like protein
MVWPHMNRSSAMAILALAGCGAPGSAAPAGPLKFPDQPVMTLTSESGQLEIEVRTAPEQPPSRGDGSVELVIRNATTSAPESGLSIEVVPWMPVMGHGASIVPSVASPSPGTYVITNVDLFMPGTWELRTTVSGSVVDHVAPSFQIP